MKLGPEVCLEKPFLNPARQIQVVNFKYYLFIESYCEAEDSQKSELKNCTSQEPNGEKTS